MSGSLTKNFGLSSTKSFMEIVQQECPDTTAAGGKQGIVVAILGSEKTRAGAGASLRRTLSADMSSKKWLAQNGVSSPMKKIASSKELISATTPLDSFSSSEEEEEEEEDYDEEEKAKEQQGHGEFDIWSLIISQKAKEDSKSNSPPYIHPLIKRSASSLSENSLKICTESLGSETGAEGFSSYPSSETGDHSEVEKESQEEEEEEEKLQLEHTVFDGEDDHDQSYKAVKFNYSAGRKSATPSFPPPLPSLSGGGASLVRMQTRRDNGRLVVEAVPIPSQKNYFAAQRRDGRLVLTFANECCNTDVDVSADPSELEWEVEKDDGNRNDDSEFEEQLLNFEENESQIGEEDEEEDDDEEVDEEVNERREDTGLKKIEHFVTEESPKVLSTRLINVHRLALMMNKPIGLANRNPATVWPPNKSVQLEGDAEDYQDGPMAPTKVAQSLPPRPLPAVGRLISSPPVAATKGAAAATATTASSFNAYEYFWRRTKPTAAAPGGLKNSSNYNNKFVVSSKNQTPNDHDQQQQLLVPFLKSCKEPRRTLFWEPYCIATSS